MNLPLYIAGRYLFARKSHNVINLISAISATGMAIGTAAVILILSIYNGFNGIIEKSISALDPDILVCSLDGGVFSADSCKTKGLEGIEGVASVGRVLQENVFLRYSDRECAATARGIDSISALHTGLQLHFGEIPLCCVEENLSREMRINPRFVEKIELWYPDRNARISPLNAPSLLNRIELSAGEAFSSGTSEGTDMIMLPLENMQELLSCEDGISGIQIFLNPQASKNKVMRKVKAIFGPDEFEVLDRYAQNESVYKMMRYEKLAIFLILVFVVIILASNIAGSLLMLIIEKREDIATLRAMGAKDSSIRKIFRLEAWMISLLGLAAGAIAGVGLALIQQHFGIIKLPGNYLIDSYPVAIQAADVAIVAVSVAITGWIISYFSSKNIDR